MERALALFNGKGLEQSKVKIGAGKWERVEIRWLCSFHNEQTEHTIWFGDEGIYYFYISKNMVDIQT